MSKGIAVVAVGGNALIRDSAHTALSDQYDAVCATAAHVVDMVAAGWNVVVTHGNGPQVGFILRRSEIADGQVPTVPIRYAVGDTQGAIGFMFQNALGNALKRRGIEMPVVALVTQTLVDKRDPAFAHPDKPVGSFMSEETARVAAAEVHRDAEQAVTIHLTHELGVDPTEKPSPLVAGASSFLMFAIGAIIPLIPYLLGFESLVAGLTVGCVGLLLVGATTSHLTSQPRVRGALRQLLFGLIAVGATYLVGLVVGVGVPGTAHGSCCPDATGATHHWLTEPSATTWSSSMKPIVGSVSV